jgi:para-nitrobenzyl esterase
MRRVLSIALVLLAACARGPSPVRLTADPATRREPPAGAVVGGVGRYGAVQWLGIPYATPPVGPRRWRVPEPAPRWSGVREALAFGAPCVQPASSLGVPGKAGTAVGNEDCLTLNVYAPPDATPASRLPVMVWIHGGGNVVGHAPFYDGGNLAVQERVVVVTVQYRLGPFGWFRHAGLRAGAADDRERSGNFGTLDQISALRWVRDDVAAFGGDPANVTIFGESAGGQDVYMLLLSPAARGLFHRAIVQSGGLWTSETNEAEALTEDGGHAASSGEVLLTLLQRTGRAADRAAARTAAARMGPGDTAAFLRSVPAAQLLTAYPIPPNGLVDLPRIFRDGTVLPAGEPLDALARRPPGVPVVAGTTHDENKLFLFGDARRIRRVLGLFPRFVDQASYETTAHYLARMWKATGADDPASALRRAGGRVWVYRFDWDEEPTVMGADLSRMLGAAHAFEIPFVFGHWDLGREGRVIFSKGNEPGRLVLSRAMMGYWAAFARTGDPGRGAGDAPAWLPWDDGGAGGPRTLILDTPAGGGIRLEPVRETPAAILAAVDADPRLATPAARCALLRDLAGWGRGYGKTEYERDTACASWPMEARPAA